MQIEPSRPTFIQRLRKLAMRYTKATQLLTVSSFHLAAPSSQVTDKVSAKIHPVRTDKVFSRNLVSAQFGCRRRAAVVIAPGLRQQSPKNGNVRGRDRRLSAVDAPRLGNWEPGDLIKCAESLDFRPYLAFLGKPGRTPDCLAGDAVQIAPVSRQIPCKQGIFQGKLRFQAPRRQF
jgi:hypothetical protein